MKHSFVLAAMAASLLVSPAFAAGMKDRQSSQQQQHQQQGAGIQDQQTARQVQQALKDQGYDVGQVDGVWGRNSQAALRQFQQDKGLQATGQPNQNTMAALGVQGGATTQQSQMPGSSRGQQERPEDQLNRPGGTSQ